jgi:hypothetical protein
MLYSAASILQEGVPMELLWISCRGNTWDSLKSGNFENIPVSKLPVATGSEHELFIWIASMCRPLNDAL